MTGIALRADPSGTYGALQVSGADVVTFGSAGVLTGNSGVVQSLVTPSVASNAMTLGWNPAPLQFRNASLAAGIPVTMPAPGTALSITLPSGATLGMVSGQQAMLVHLIAYNGGNPVSCVVNVAGGVDLSESGLISPTTISAGATSAGIIYSASAVAANSQYRVVGYYLLTEATAGTYLTLPSMVVGDGGKVLAAMQSLGYGQTWQITTLVSGTTYYNTSAKPIVLLAYATVSALGIAFSVGSFTSGTITGGSGALTIIVPPGIPYSFSVSSGTFVFQVMK